MNERLGTLLAASTVRPRIADAGWNSKDNVAGDLQPEHAAGGENGRADQANVPDQRLQATDAAPVLIWGATVAGANDWFSPSWSAFTGCAPEALRGDGWTRSIHPEDIERCVGIRAASFQAPAPFTMDFRLRRRDGEYRWMLDNGVPRFGSDGALTDFVGSAVDIHERKMLEESLAERTQALRLAERRQGQFLAMLSHELRNPLAPIANAASVLRTLEHSNPILVRLREILDRQVGRLRRLVEELIDVTRAAQGQISLVKEPVSIDGIVQTAVAQCHGKLNAGGHRLEVDVSDQRLQVRGDAARLAQALANLIGNAAKFTLEPGVVTITVRRAAKTVQISVKDHGEGIDPAFLPLAFELFAQQDQTLARSLGGLGVGLTLTRRIVQLHGGDVEAFSEGLGQGAEFILWLPLLEEAAGAAKPASVANSEARNPGESYRVLIVEDDADALESLRLQMELWGNEVTTAGSADEALAIALEARPQIVLCDIGLPGMDGLKLVRALRTKLDNTGVMFAAVTGYASGNDEERALAAGFDSFLVKPLEPGSLARLFRSVATRAVV
ncbi:MAG: ATP-binding protein [Pseudomonadota bacterium]|nr:ATP-binding protein [Pseudomonadota bacterium]